MGQEKKATWGSIFHVGGEEMSLSFHENGISPSMSLGNKKVIRYDVKMKN